MIVIFSLIGTILLGSSIINSIAQNVDDSEPNNDLLQTSLSNNINNTNSIQNQTNIWINVSGNWNLEGDTLHGGSTNDSVGLASNIILYPIIPEGALNISSSFKINEANLSEANYAGLVYSFVDPLTYKYATLNIYNQTVYAIFYNVDNGTVTTDPNWPGINTNLKWQPGTVFDITLVTEGSTLALNINGTEYYSQPLNNDSSLSGYVGLQYGRITSIDFLNFEISPQNQPLDRTSMKAGSAAKYSVSDSQSILLEGESFPSGSYIHLYGTSPYIILSGHVAANLPCDEDNNTDVNLLVGELPSLIPINLEFIPQLSQSNELCMYHGDIKSTGNNPITDIVISNNDTNEIEFPDTSSIVVSVSEISRK